MLKFKLLAMLGLGSVLSLGTAVRAADAPDFTPGVATDGNRYDLADLKGKVVVLFFFEAGCPRCKGLVPERNKMVQSYADQPVKFIAIDPGHNVQEAAGYVTETKLVMPVFADPLRVMEARYNEHISLQNVYQFKVIAPDGTVAGFNEDAIKQALPSAKWKYKGQGYDHKLDVAVDALEWNQYAQGLRLLKPMLKNSNKAVVADAQKLWDSVKAEAEQWKSEADGEADSKPVDAFDQYTRVAALFPSPDPLGKSVVEPLKKLKSNADVKKELQDRAMFGQIDSAMSKANTTQKEDVVSFCRAVAKKFPDTPTAQKATALADEMEKKS